MITGSHDSFPIRQPLYHGIHKYVQAAANFYAITQRIHLTLLPRIPFLNARRPFFVCPRNSRLKRSHQSIIPCYFIPPCAPCTSLTNRIFSTKVCALVARDPQQQPRAGVRFKAGLEKWHEIFNGAPPNATNLERTVWSSRVNANGRFRSSSPRGNVNERKWPANGVSWPIPGSPELAIIYPVYTGSVFRHEDPGAKTGWPN